jgi:hypothetical protein
MRLYTFLFNVFTTYVVGGYFQVDPTDVFPVLAALAATVMRRAHA